MLLHTGAADVICQKPPLKCTLLPTVSTFSDVCELALDCVILLFCSIISGYFYLLGLLFKVYFEICLIINTRPVVMTAIDSIYIFNNSKQFLSRLKIHSSPHHLEAHLPTNIYLTLLLHVLDCPVVFLIFNAFVAVNHFIV